MKKILLGLGTIAAVVAPVASVVACGVSRPNATITEQIDSSKSGTEVKTILGSFKDGTIKDLLTAIDGKPSKGTFDSAIETDKVTKVIVDGNFPLHWEVWTDKYIMRIPMSFNK